MNIAFIVPTKDRPDDIRRMLSSLDAQTRRPDQIIIVDASKNPIAKVVNEFASLNIYYNRWSKKPSAAGQRNYGVQFLQDDIALVCFFDDDQILYPDAIETMVAFWEAEINGEHGLSRIGATSFFDANWKDARSVRLKNSRLSEKLGLYKRKPGCVAASGWQSLYYGAVKGKTLDVEWISSQAIVLQRHLLKEFRFDEFFKGYSYLEDLDFSYSISRNYRIVVVAEAKFDHAHSLYGRQSAYEFGRAEVRNRKYIVKKHGLSMSSYRLAMMIRCVMSFLNGEYYRACGNIIEVLKNVRVFKIYH